MLRPPAASMCATSSAGDVARVEEVVARGPLDRAVVDGPDIVERQLRAERLLRALRRVPDIAQEMLVHERRPEVGGGDGAEHGLHLDQAGRDGRRVSWRPTVRRRAVVPSMPQAVGGTRFTPGAV